MVYWGNPVLFFYPKLSCIGVNYWKGESVLRKDDKWQITINQEEYYKLIGAIHSLNRELNELKCRLEKLYLKRTKEENNDR